MSGETGLPTRWTVIRTGPLGRKEIIDVAGGPASVNAEMQVRGKRVVAVDPLYSFSPAEIEQRFYAASDGIMRQVRETPEDWVWTFHRSPEQLRARRVQALARFLADYFEMLRIAAEVLVFPLLTLAMKPSPYRTPLLEDLASAGYVHEIRTVPYELQRGGNQMLCVKRAREK